MTTLMPPRPGQPQPQPRPRPGQPPPPKPPKGLAALAALVGVGVVVLAAGVGVANRYSVARPDIVLLALALLWVGGQHAAGLLRGNRPASWTARRRIAVVLLLLVGGLALAGCDPDSGGHTQTCTVPGPSDGPSPPWSFRCEVRPR